MAKQENKQPKDAIVDLSPGALQAAELETLFQRIDNATPEKFVEVDGDTWKPVKEGDKLYGAYLGKEASDFVNEETGQNVPWHFIACRSVVDNTPMVKRVLETATLSSRLAGLSRGDLLTMTYLGTAKTKAGFEAHMYSVAVEPRAAKR